MKTYHGATKKNIGIKINDELFRRKMYHDFNIFAREHNMNNVNKKPVMGD